MGGKTNKQKKAFDETFKLPWARMTKPAMMITMRASTFATVEMTCRMAPHFTFMQFTKVNRAAGKDGKNQKNGKSVSS